MKIRIKHTRKEPSENPLPYIGEFEEIVLLAAYKLGNEAYGVTIRQLVEDAAERPTSIGAIYATLDRLEQKGFISSYQGEPTPERGGRAKRYFKVEGTGIKVLREINRIRSKMLSGIDLGLEPIQGKA